MQSMQIESIPCTITSIDKLSSKLLSDACYLAQVAPSGECLRAEGQAYLIGLLAT